ncbi:MAG: prephenate dehydrogenase [Clostridia bacterium]|nr:prephenate dehydrogenase [Clostridia bacterium]
MLNATRKVTIIGLGLIGGSFALALKRLFPGINLCGYDVDETALVKGQEAGIIDWFSMDVKEAVRDADLTVISCSLNQTVPMAIKAIPHMKRGAILTDVGSVKETIVTSIEAVLPGDISYVPGHPMAGSEKKGLDGADTYLFENSAYILTPTEKTAWEAVDTLLNIIKGIGARPLIMSPSEHDNQVAAVSHLPHLLAAALVNSASALRDRYPDLFLLAAGGFRDTTRIASSQPDMWRDICLNNRRAILEVLEIHEGKLAEIKKSILKGDGEGLFCIFKNARENREKVPAGIKGILPELFEIVVVVPDRPGMIGQIANLLGERNINIIDIEILRVREGDGGTIRFGFLNRDAAQGAVKVLREENFVVYPKFS